MFLLNLQKHLIKAGAFALKNWLITRNRGFHVFEILFWPFIGLISVGLLTQFLGLEPRTTQFILIGVIALNVVQVAQLDMAYVVLYGIWNRSLRNEMVAPIGVFHLAAGSWAMGAIHALLILLLMSSFSAVAFHVRFWEIGLIPLLLLFGGLLFFAASIGMMVCGLAFRFGGRAHVGAASIVSILILLSGIYYPVEILPEPVRAISFFIPLTYFLEYFRSFYGFIPRHQAPLLIGFLLVLAYNMAGFWFLSSSVSNARAKGILTQLFE